MKYYMSREHFESLDVTNKIRLEASLLSDGELRNDVPIKFIPVLRTMDNLCLVKEDGGLIIDATDISICEGTKDIMMNLIYTLKNTLMQYYEGHESFNEAVNGFRDTALSIIGVMKQHDVAIIIVNIVFENKEKLSRNQQKNTKIIELNCKDVPYDTKMVLDACPFITE